MHESYGDFTLLKHIASGGMAEIYLAETTNSLGHLRQLVIKRMLPELAVREDFWQMFLDEADLAASLHHPNIVEVFSFGTVGNSQYIAMELVDGAHLGSLFAHSLRSKNPLPIDLCVHILARTADGLHCAHNKCDDNGKPLAIVHRDMSPQNILVSRHGDVKITDFGVAKASSQKNITRTGIIKGKVAYMSPEQCLGDPIDRQTDVFALGIVLYELLTRRRLYRDKSDLLIMQRITTEKLAPPSSLNPAIDKDLDAITLKALAIDKKNRFASADDLADALDVWLANKGYTDGHGGLGRWLDKYAPHLCIEADDEPPLVAELETVATPASTEDSDHTVVLDPLAQAETFVAAQQASISLTQIEPVPTPLSEDGPPPSIVDDGDVFSIQPPPIPETTLESTVIGPPPAKPMPYALFAGIALLAVIAIAAFFVWRDDGTPVDIIAELPQNHPDAAGTLATATTLDAKTPDASAAAEDLPDAAVAIAPDVADVPNKITIRTRPSAIPISVDGKAAGVSPIEVAVDSRMVITAVFADQPAVRRVVRKNYSKDILLLARVPVQLKSKPKGARVRIAGKTVGETPKLDGVWATPGRPLRIEFSADGYRDATRRIVPEEGKPVVVNVDLQKKTVKAKPYGTISVYVKPWGKVIIDGRSFGDTPVVSRRLRAGKHTVQITNPKLGFSGSLVVNVSKNTQHKVVFRWEKRGNSYKFMGAKASP